MIGIIAAMQEEAEHLKSHMLDIQAVRVAHCTFYRGQLNNKDVVLAESGIGKVNAAITATLLIERYHPSYIINTGSAGGLDQALAIGDVVISLEVRHHDVDLTVFGYEHGQLPKLPAAFMPHRPLVDAAEAAAASLKLRVTKGMIASGDVFMNDAIRADQIRARFGAVQAVEMEAAAVAQVCHQFQVPFVIIRALSDIAGKESAMSFKTFLEQAALHSAQLIIAMLETLD